MKKLFNGLLTILCILISSLSLHAADSTPNRQVRIGTLLFNPPFEVSYPARQTFSGFEVDIMSTACQRLSLDCEFIPVASVLDIFNQLAQNRFDLAVASIIVFKGNGDYVFSTPYLPSGIQFFTKKESKLKTLEDITKSHIGTTDDPLIRTLVTVDYAKTYPLTVYDTPQAGVDALASGKIDAFVMQTATTRYWLSNTSDAFKAVGDSIQIGLGNGAVAMSSAADLMGQFNQAILSMQNDGTYAQIYNRYNLL